MRSYYLLTYFNLPYLLHLLSLRLFRLLLFSLTRLPIFLFLLHFNRCHSNQYRPPFIHLRLLRIVDPELSEQNLVFVLRKRPLEPFVRLSLSEPALLNEGPEGRVV